jgi:hypothetical protein
MKVHYRELALADLESIFLFLNERSARQQPCSGDES